MASQTNIVLRTTEASPKNVRLYPLPIAPVSQGATIYVFPGHASAKNITLRNPAAAPAVSGGTVNASLAASLGAVTLSSDVDVVVGSSLAASLGAVTLSSDVDVVVGSSLAASLGAVTLGSDVDVVVGTSLAASLGAVTLSSDASVTFYSVEVGAPLPVQAPTSRSYTNRYGRIVTMSPEKQRRMSM